MRPLAFPNPRLYTQNVETSPSRYWDLPGAFLFVAALSVSVGRLLLTDWTEHLGLTLQLAWLGAILGSALGVSRFGRRATLLFVAGYTLVLVPNRLMAPYYSGEIDLGERLLVLGGRLIYSLSEFAAGRAIRDPIVFLTLMGLLYWTLALTAGYHLVRHNRPLVAILPAGAILLIVHHFDRFTSGRAWLLTLYFLFSLILLSRSHYLHLQEGWRQRGMRLSPEAGADLTMGALIGALAVLLLASSLPIRLADSPPSLQDAWDGISRPWRAARDRLSRAFEALRGPAAVRRSELFRNTLALGIQAAQGEDLILSVRLPAQALQTPRLYWRVRVYDRYADGQWTLSPSLRRRFSPSAEPRLPLLSSQTHLEYEALFTSYVRGQATLILPAQTTWISRPADVEYVPLPDGRQDLLFLETFPYLQPGETYRVRAALINPTLDDLRAAGQDYPVWATERYTQLPEPLAERLRAFARSIAGSQPTPYDQAEAITAALRTHIAYRSAIPPPPPDWQGNDPIEWILFDLKQGFCNHYATAEVLLLRSLGIPARLAVGFLQGTPAGPAQGGLLDYRVAVKHMHAWPEVYFPGIGWIEFEPTANQEPILRPDDSDSDLEPAASPPSRSAPARPPSARPDEEILPSQSFEPVARWRSGVMFALMALLLTAVLLAIPFFDRSYRFTVRAARYLVLTSARSSERFPAWLQQAALFTLANPFERAFHSINLCLRWLDGPPSAHLTPAERASLLQRLLPNLQDDIALLLHEYQAAEYSPHPRSPQAAQCAAWQILREGLRVALRQRFR